MDLVSSCKEKLKYFQKKELQDVLTQLGLPMYGRKQDLVDRILAFVSDDQVSKRRQGRGKENQIGREGVAKIIHDTYRNILIHGAADQSSKGGQSDSDVGNAKLKEIVDDFAQLEMKVRCPCGSSLLTESMIQCKDQRCLVWQHIGCVIIPEKPMQGVPPLPSQFYCEICRINRADPLRCLINKTTREERVSGYEQIRERRIKENMEKMQKLGILHLKSDILPPKQQRPRTLPSLEPQRRSLEPQRRSSRLQNVTPSSRVEGEDLIRGGVQPEIYTVEHAVASSSGCLCSSFSMCLQRCTCKANALRCQDFCGCNSWKCLRR